MNNPQKPNGKHLIIDLYEAHHLNDMAVMKAAIADIIKQTNATLLSEQFHHFLPSGITGIACLAESHISVHTWPESNFAAFDIFMCGNAQPDIAVDILKQYFGGTDTAVLIERGTKVIETA